MSNTPFKASWSEYTKDMTSTNLDTALKATDAYQEAKAKELKTSKRARKWEKSKNEVLMKEKPEWVKEKREKEQAPFKKMITELKSGGKFDTGIKPMPGFILVKPEFKDTTDSGIALVSDDSAKMNTNKGVVLATGDERVDLYKVVYSPVNEGDHVMFKKGLPGLEMDVKGEYCLLMQWSDILAKIL